MVDINHDWDESDTKADLEAAFLKYMKACYGGQMVNLIQIREVRQAFLSGIHWLNTKDDYCPTELEQALRELLLPDKQEGWRA